MTKPIGYWLKHLDNLFETTFERTLQDHDLTRRHWQVLTTIAGGPRKQAELDELLAPFQAHVQSEVDDLVTRGWATRHDGLVTITGDGSAAHYEVSQKIRATRARVTDGISEEEYLRTVGTLRRMVANLEA